MRTALLTALLVAPLALSAQTNEPAVRLSLNENGEYESGDKARVRVRTERDGYLVVLRTEVDGWIRVLYPTDPFHDHFVRGGGEFEVRGRGDREAFQASWRGGSGIVLAAYSAQPFDFTGFTRNDHWDYRVLDTLKSASDPEAALLAIVDQMADSTSVEYDVLTYTISGPRSTRYTSTYYYQSWSPYYSSHYYYDYHPYYSSYNYGWYRPYYRPYFSCYFCYSPGWYVGFGYGYRPWWGYRSHYYGYYGRPWRPYYSSYAFGNSYRSWNRFAFNDWNRSGTTAGRALRNARTGEVAVQSRYTADLADRRRREVSVTAPTGTGQTATVMRRVTQVAGVVRREFVAGDRSATVRRDVTAGGSRTIQRVEVPERRAAESRGFSSSGRTYNGGRPANDGGGRSVSRDRPDGGRVTPSRAGGVSRPSSGGGRISDGGGSRPSSSGGGGRVSDGGGRRSPGTSSAPSRGSSGGGGDRSAPSSGGEGRRRG